MAASVPIIILGSIFVYTQAFICGCLVVAYCVFQQLCSPTKCLFGTKRRDTPPKCLQDKELGQHGYVTVKGLKFHYVEKGDKSKPLMLFVHGFPEFWYSWRHQMKEFSKDYWTVAVDMRGYGDSAKPPKVDDYHVRLLVDDIKGIVNALGREKFILVAHDWGAVISWTFVDVYPEMIDKYIMMNGPHSKVYGAMLLKSPAQFLKSWYIFLFQMPYIAEMFAQFNDLAMMPKMFLGSKKSHPYVTDDDIEAFKYTFSKPDSCTFPLYYYKSAIRTRIMNGFALQNTKGKTVEKAKRPPGLYIFGAKDIALDVSNVSKHKEYFDNLETVIIQEGNHFIQQDEPHAVNKAMRSFLK